MYRNAGDNTVPICATLASARSCELLRSSLQVTIYFSRASCPQEANLLANPKYCAISCVSPLSSGNSLAGPNVNVPLPGRPPTDSRGQAYAAMPPRSSLGSSLHLKPYSQSHGVGLAASVSGGGWFDNTVPVNEAVVGGGGAKRGEYEVRRTNPRARPLSTPSELIDRRFCLFIGILTVIVTVANYRRLRPGLLR